MSRVLPCLLLAGLLWGTVPGGAPGGLAAAVPPAVAPSAPGGGAAFALVDPALAAALSGRAASAYTRAILIHAASNQQRVARPVAWVSGEADSLDALADLPVLVDLALAWRLGWDARAPAAAAQAARFRDAALGMFEAWISTCRITFLPLNESRFDTLLVSWDLLKAAASPELQEKAGRWLRALAEGYLVDRPGQPPAASADCWQSHRLKLASLAAFALADPGLIAGAEAAFCRQIDANLGADGSPRDFTEHDALAYAVYDLQPLVLAALAARNHGRDWYRYRGRNGASLEDALSWLAARAAGRQPHREFMDSRVDAERQSALSGSNGLGQPWNPVNAGGLFWLAVRLDERWLPLAARLGRDQSWLALLFPTAAPPPMAAPPPKPAAAAGTTGAPAAAAGSPARAGPAGSTVSRAQAQALLQALRGGASGGTATGLAGAAAGGGKGGSALSAGDILGKLGGGANAIPSLLSLFDTLGASGGNGGGESSGQ